MIRRMVLALFIACVALTALGAGVPIEEPPLEVTGLPTAFAAVAATNDRFLVVWSQYFPTGADTYSSYKFGRLLDGNGLPIGDRAFPIAPATTQWFVPEVLAHGAGFLMVSSGPDGIFLWYISRDGAVAPPVRVGVDGLHVVAASSNGTDILLVANGNRQTHFLIVSNDGSVAKRETPRVQLSSESRHLTVVPAGAAFFVRAVEPTAAFWVFSDDRPLRLAPTGGTSLTHAAGIAIGPERVLIATRNQLGVHTPAGFESVSRGPFEYPLGMTRENGHIRIVWSTREEQVSTALFDLTGELIPGTVQNLPLEWHILAGHIELANNGERTVIVGTDERTSNEAALLSPDWADVEPAITHRTQRQPILVPDGAGFRAFWQEEFGGFGASTEIRTARFTAEGEKLDSSAVARDLRLAEGAVASNGSGFFAVAHDDFFAYGIAVDASGRASEPIRLGDEPDFDLRYFALGAAVAWNGHGWVVVTANPGFLRLHTVTANGVVSSSRDLTAWLDARPAPGVSIWAQSPALVRTNDILLLTFTEVTRYCFQMCGPIVPRFPKAIRLRPDGVPIDAVARVISEIESMHTTMATDGRDVLLITDARTYATPVRANSRTFELGARREVAYGSWRSTLFWDGREYVLAQQSVGRPGTTIALRRLDRTGRIVHEGELTVAGHSDEEKPGVATTLSGTFLALDLSRQPEIPRALLYTADDLRPVASPPAPPANVRVSAAPAPDRLRITWDPSPGSVDRYLVELWFGQQQTTQSVGPDQLTLDVPSKYTAVSVRSIEDGRISVETEKIPLHAPRRRTMR
ncbi:MAG TPA: hypothetical protein VF618_03065 [Thermoanaerobaculia bacterium]